jgi:hypothetical protein
MPVCVGRRADGSKLGGISGPARRFLNGFAFWISLGFKFSHVAEIVFRTCYRMKHCHRVESVIERTRRVYERTV